MIYGSVCSGIEAASVAWHPLGWRAAFLSEIEAFPRAVLAHHYPDTPLHGDFTTIQAGQYEPIELLVGGTPCQSFSVAGLRGGLADDRGNLALQFLKLADRLRPRWVVWENVPGVLSSNGGRDFGSILGGLGELGYGWAYRVLDAQYFGVPQRRRRVFVVGCLGDWRRAVAVLFERHSLSGYPAPRRQAGQGPAATLTNGFGERGVDADQIANGNYAVAPALTGSGRGVERVGESRGQDPVIPTFITSHDPAMTLTAREYKGALPEADLPTVVAQALRADGFDASEHGTGQANRSHPRAGGTDHPLAAGAHPPAVVAFPLQYGAAQGGKRQNGAGVGEAEAPSYTLDSQGPMHGVATGMAVRRLTPRECERLQGFPDDYTQVPYRGKPAADGPRYKALGNSMAVPVMAWIGQRIQMVEALGVDAAAA